MLSIVNLVFDLVAARELCLLELEPLSRELCRTAVPPHAALPPPPACRPREVVLGSVLGWPEWGGGTRCGGSAISRT